MLNSLKIELEGEIGKSRSDLLGSLFQGFIMENIDKNYADKLHCIPTVSMWLCRMIRLYGR